MEGGSESTSDVNWKNVSYCTLETVNISSNFSDEISSLKHLIVSHITICSLLCEFGAPKWSKILFLPVFNNFDPLTYNIVTAVILMTFSKIRQNVDFTPKMTFFWDIYPLFSYICKNGWWNQKTYKVWHFGPFSTILRWFLVFYQCILVIFSKSLFETQWPGLGPPKWSKNIFTW